MALRSLSTLSPILFCLATVQCMVPKLKGQAIQWVPGVTEPPDMIHWSHNGNEVVEFNGTVEKVFGSFEGRVTLNKQNGELQISDLRLEDSGKYESEIHLRGKLLRSSYELRVIEKVGKPTITCEMVPDSNSSAVLQCIEDLSQDPSPLDFLWFSGEKVLPGTRLTIPLGGELNEHQYTCQVSNFLCQENATFTAKHCNKVSNAGLSGGTIAAIVIIVILVISACVILLLLALKRYKKKKEEEEERWVLKPLLGNISRVETSGASLATANQDRLGYSGVEASHAMAKTDAGRVEKYRSHINRAARNHGVDPAVVTAIMSRASRAGNALRDGWGDGGRAWGLMQVDVTPDGGNHPKIGDWDSYEHIDQATEILAYFIGRIEIKFPDWSAEQKLKGGIAAYNVGDGAIHSYQDVDANGMGRDYSDDVVARAQWYKKNHGFK